MTHHHHSRSLQRVTALLRRFAADTQGGVLIITGLASLFLLLLFFALSIDHGRNYMDHADLDAKLKNLSLHLAEDWASFRQKEAAAAALVELGLTWERSAEDTAIAKKTSVLWELPEPFGPLNETHAKQLVSQRMLQLIRSHPGLERTSLVEVEQDCNAQNRMLLRFAAKIPMSEQFIKPEDRAGSNCTAAINPLNPQSEEGCTLVTHTVALGIGCEPGSVPPDSIPPDEVGGGSFCPMADGTYPHLKSMSGGGGDLAEGGKVVTIVKSLDFTSAQNMQDADDVVELARKIAVALDMPKDDIAAGAVIGNRPVASSDGSIVCNGDPNLGWSGSCYDTSEGFNGGDFAGPRQANAHRKHSFVGTFLAQMVRQCGAEPVWTYDIKKAGSCWEEDDNEECDANGWGAGSCCVEEFEDDDDFVGVVTNGTNNGSIKSKDRCGKKNNKWKSDGTCDNKDKVTRHTCLLKDPKPVYQGQWYAACPRTAMTPAGIYKDPADSVSLTAHYSRKLDDGTPTHTLNFPPAEATIAPYAGGFLGELNQADELETLKKYNTDRSWLWACETDFAPDGRMGRPYGRLADRPLVELGDVDINQKGSAAGCAIPAAPNGGLMEYMATFNLPGCSDPQQTGCDLSEGFFRTEIDISGLNPARKPSTGIMLPDGELNTRWEYQGDEKDGGWAYQAAATVPADADLKGNDMDECPVKSGGVKNRKYLTSQRAGANDRHARYILDVPDEDGIVVPEIPEEHLNIASYQSERRRVQGVPFTCLFDKGDDNLAGTKKDFVEGPVEKGLKTYDSYPWFSDYDKGGQKLEHPFWQLDGRGVLAFSGDNAGQYILGVEQASGFLTHEGITGDTDTTYDSKGYNEGTRNLVQLQALDMVRWMESDYAPANTGIKVGGVHRALALTSVPYSKFDIHGGHDANQCAMIKAGAQTLMSNPLGANATADERVLIFVGSCPQEDWSNTQYNGLDVNWHAGGNRVGALTGLQLQALETPARGTNLRTQTEQCFQQAAAGVGNVFVITSGEECTLFAQNASRSSNPDMCPLPYCVLGVDSEGDCVDRLFSCIRKRATGGS